MTKLIRLFLILLITVSCKVQTGAAPVGNNGDRGPNGDRGSNCSRGVTACLNKADWLIEFKSMLPANLKLEINGVIVKDECRNGDTGAAIVNRKNKTIEIENYYKPNGSSEIRVTDRGSNCMGNSEWMQRLMPRETQYQGNKYIYFYLDY